VPLIVIESAAATVFRIGDDTVTFSPTGKEAGE
jgi:hypothetical protein